MVFGKDKKTTKKGAAPKVKKVEKCVEHKDKDGNWFPPLSPVCVICGA